VISAVTEINDAAILKRAKQLCVQDGVAWDSFSTTAPGVRVLNDRDRRECLMRARHELINEAIEAGTWQYGKPVTKQSESVSEQPPAQPGGQAKKSAITTTEPTFWPKRRVA
jgi:hypothetical protein